MISFSSDFFPDSIFLVNDLILNATEVNDVSSSNFELTYLFNISSLHFSKGQSYHHWSWKQSGFSLQHVGVIVVFDIEALSTDFVSVFEHRTISLNIVGNLYSDLTCSIDSQQFTGITSNNSLFCEDVIIPTYQEFVDLELSFDGVLINSVEIQGEAFLEDVCFVSFVEHPRINFTNTFTNNLMFDGIRCCNVDVSFCSEFISQFDLINAMFDTSFDIFQIVITTNTSCHESYYYLPFELIAKNQTLSPAYSCKQVPSGFAFASMCTIDLVIPRTTEILLVALENLFILELEIYGHVSDSCFKPFSFGRGITALGEVIDEDVYLGFETALFNSTVQFESFISQKEMFWSTSTVQFSTGFSSPNCFYSFTPFLVTLSASDPTSLVFSQTIVEVNSNYLSISIPMVCVDNVGFFVDCNGSIDIIASTFKFNSVVFFSDNVIFFFNELPQLQEHRVDYEFNSRLLNWNGTLVQNCAEYLTVDQLNVSYCGHQYYGDQSCTLLNITSKFVIQEQFYNLTSEVLLSDITLVTDIEAGINILDDRLLELVTSPLQSMTITLSYFSHTATIDLVSNDCHFPKLNSGHGCLCPKGMEFNYLGECVECFLNYYSNSEFNSECRSCPFPRITLQKGSSDLDHCVCPLNTLDSIDSCLPCPHLAECGYGNLTGIEPGFRLNTDTWELDECVFWYSCHENSCRSRHAYGDLCQYCTEDAVFSKIYCFSNENTWLKVLSFICFVSILFVADRLPVQLSLVDSKFKYIELAASSLSTFGQRRLLEQLSNYFNILNIFFLFCLRFSSAGCLFGVLLLNLYLLYFILIRHEY
ncbi:hypothetical protein GEMRC1_009446 [Eukaryota sp. GEM-RC1]